MVAIDLIGGAQEKCLPRIWVQGDRLEHRNVKNEATAAIWKVAKSLDRICIRSEKNVERVTAGKGYHMKKCESQGR